MPRIMPPKPRRRKETGVFWLKGKVPDDVVALGYAKQYSRSLGTSETKEVATAVANLWLALNREWESARQGPIDLTDEQIAALAGEAYAIVTAPTSTTTPRWGKSATSFTLDGFIDQLLADKGLSITAKTRESLHNALIGEYGVVPKALEAEDRKRKGDYSGTLPVFPGWQDPPVTSPPTAGKAKPRKGSSGVFTFTDAVALWKRLKTPVDKTAATYARYWKELAQLVGHDDVSRLTSDDLRRWRDKLALPSRGLKPRTIKEQHLAAINVVLNMAVSEGKIATNVAKGVGVVIPKGDDKRGRSFTEAEAHIILKAALAPPNKGLKPSHQCALRWVPWLTAYCGARTGEMVQLRKQDIRMDPTADGPVAVIDITPEAGSTKTGKSRIVPIHPHLIDEGFLAFVERSKPGYLFVGDDRTPVKGKLPLNLRDARVNDLGQWVREIGVSAPDVQPNHGWRHTFKTIARGMRPPMTTEVRDRIQGHAPRTEGEGYGETPLAVLKDEMHRFPRFNPDGKSEGFR